MPSAQPKSPPPADTRNQFDDVFQRSIGKILVFYTDNGKAMTGRLRSYDTDSVLFDSRDGRFGATALLRSKIVMVTQHDKGSDE